MAVFSEIFQIVCGGLRPCQETSKAPRRARTVFEISAKHTLRLAPFQHSYPTSLSCQDEEQKTVKSEQESTLSFSCKYCNINPSLGLDLLVGSEWGSSLVPLMKDVWVLSHAR